LAVRRKSLGEEHLDVALGLNNLAIVYSRQKKYEVAEPLFQQALSIREKALGLDHVVSLSSLANLAAFYRVRGEFLRSGELYKEMVARWERKLGTNHPEVVAALNDWASVLREAKQNVAAKEVEQRVRMIRASQRQESKAEEAVALK